MAKRSGEPFSEDLLSKCLQSLQNKHEPKTTTIVLLQNHLKLMQKVVNTPENRGFMKAWRTEEEEEEQDAV